MLLSFLTERIPDAAHPSGRVDQQHVEPDAGFAPIRMLCQQDLRRRQEPRPLPRGERECRAGKIGTRLHLDERKHPVALGGDVDFAGRCAQASSQHAPSVALQRGAGDRFRVDAADLAAASEKAAIARCQAARRPSATAWQAASVSPTRV